MSQTTPIHGRFGSYPVRRDDDMFRSVHSAWMQSWSTFTERLKDPSAPTKTEKTYSRSVLEILMRMCEEVPAIVNTEMWANREADMSGRVATDVIKQWSTVLNTELNGNTPIRDKATLRLLVSTVANIRLSANDAKNKPLAGLVTLNRNVCAQLLSSCSANLLTATGLHTEGVLSALVNHIRVGGMDLEEEDMTLQSLLHFLIQGSYVWQTLGPDRYPARDWSRQVFQFCQPVLEPVDTREDKNPPSTNARGRALMAILVRISPQRCLPHHLEHTRGLFEVPGLLKNIIHWFYERHSMPESFDDVATEIVRDLTQNSKQLPKFISQPLEKALKFGQKCFLCGRSDPGLPLVTACACKEVYYCSRACQSESWKSHKANCKASWQDEVLAPVATGEITTF